MLDLPPFSEEEFATLADTAFFRRKAAVTARIRASFEALRDALAPGLPADGWLCRGDLDVRQGYLVAAEDYRGLPYVVLDFPKHFSRAEFLTMRTLFWWGHYAVFSLIVRGPWLPEAGRRVCEALPALEAAGIEGTLAADPWDWRRGRAFSRPLRADDATRAWVRAAAFLKLMRFLPLAPDTFTPEAIVDTGRESWALYGPLVRRAAP